MTNIQRYLDPGAEVFIGDKPYKKMVEESAQGLGLQSEPLPDLFDDQEDDESEEEETHSGKNND